MTKYEKMLRKRTVKKTKEHFARDGESRITDTKVEFKRNKRFTLVIVTETEPRSSFSRRRAKFLYQGIKLVASYFSGHLGGSWTAKLKENSEIKFKDGNGKTRSVLNIGYKGQVFGLNLLGENGAKVPHEYKTGNWSRRRAWQIVPTKEGQ